MNFPHMVATLFVLALLLSACAAGTPAAPAAAPTQEAAGATMSPPTQQPTSPGETVKPPAVVTEASTGKEGLPLPAGKPYDVEISAADGLKIKGTFYPASGAPPHAGVLLLPILGASRTTWVDFATKLADAGYTALAIDLRGQGETGGSADWTKARDDVQRAWAYLAGQPDVDPTRTAIIGASIGANLALITGAAEPEVKTVALLSPGLDYRGVTTTDAVKAYGDRPLLIVASQEDTYAAQSSQSLRDLAQGEAQLQMYDGAGHGTAMLSAKPELSGLLLSWLSQYL
jgi:dienelactone hydrolase